MEPRPACGVQSRMTRPDPYDDRAVLLGLVFVLGALLITLAIWAGNQPLPRWRADGFQAARLARAWITPGPPPARPAAQTTARSPVADTGSRKPVSRDTARPGDAPSRGLPHELRPQAVLEPSGTDWATLSGTAAAGRDHGVPGSLRSAGDLRGRGDHPIGPVRRLGATDVAVARVTVAPPHPRATAQTVVQQTPRRISKDALSRVLRERRRDMETCLTLADRHMPGTAGRVVLHLRVRGGAVSNVDVVDDTVGSMVLRRCLASRAHAWRFPAGTNGTARVPLAFAGR